MRYTGSWLARGDRCGSGSNRRLYSWLVLVRLLLWIHGWWLRRLWRWELVFRMGHLIMRFRGFETGSCLRMVRFIHSRRCGCWLRFSVGCNGEAPRLHLVGLLGVGVMPHGGNFRLLAGRCFVLRYLRLLSALLLDVGLDHLRGGASGIVSMLAFFEQHGNHDLRISPWRDPNEPSIVLEVLSFGAEPLLQVVGDRLRAARFSREVDALQGGAGRCAHRRDHLCQSVGDQHPVVFIETHVHLIAVIRHLFEAGRELIGERH